MKINYDGRRFRSVENSDTGQVGSETVFDYHQSGNIVTAEYRGGEIAEGHLIAVCDAEGRLDMRYHHVNSLGELMTGICVSTPEILIDGRIRLREEWQWTCGSGDKGRSVVEEF
jgi:hypothetical protein